MRLVPFSPEHLRMNNPLPFDVVDAVGNLLMRRGSVISTREQLEILRSHTLMVDEEATEEWRRGLAGAIDTMIRQNATLKTIANVRPQPMAAPAHPSKVPLAPPSLEGEIVDLQTRVSSLLRETRPDAAWRGRLASLGQRLATLAQREPDASLYLLVQTSTQTLQHYSSHHALLCTLVVELVAAKLQVPPDELQSLRMASMSMNLSMTELQNTLAERERPLTREQRELIDSHPQRSVEMLRAAGVDDPLWLEIVSLHHEDVRPVSLLVDLSPAQRLARVLRRVDVFTAKISPRQTRPGLPAPLAARDACLGANGQPDEVGAAMIKAIGIYPPGSFVQLASGELAVVIRRGVRANQPRVASILGRDGQLLASPSVREAADPRHEIRSSVRATDVRVRLNQARILSLI